MKIATLQLILIAGVYFVTSLKSLVRAAEPGVYFGLDGGINLANDIDADFDFGPVSFGGDAEFDTGFRFDILGGYNINEFFGIELESGFIYNSFDSIRIAGFPIDQGDSWAGRVPLLANAIFRFENDTGWTPYGGVGVGGAFSILEIDQADTDTDFVPAWQAQAGVRYALDETSSLGIGYKYFGTTSQTYDIDGVGIDLEASHNHAFLVTVTFSF